MRLGSVWGLCPGWFGTRARGTRWACERGRHVPWQRTLPEHNTTPHERHALRKETLR